MRLTVLDNAKEVGEFTARIIAARIEQFRPYDRRQFVLGLPTGSTPIPVYQHLIRFYRLGKLSFRSVITFNMDEYYGLPRTHPQSYAYFMHQQLFNHVDILPEQCHILDGNTQNWQRECDNYETEIRHVGGVQLFLGGLGVDGHLAFNEPGSTIDSRTRLQKLTKLTRISNARFFSGDITNVPKMALTIGIATLLESQEIVIIATGSHKAAAVRTMLEGHVSSAFPASFLQNHANTVVICDKAAAANISAGTREKFLTNKLTI